MKFTLFLILLVFTATVFSQGKKTEDNRKFEWTEETAKKHLQNREDPKTWDMRLFKEDLKFADQINRKSLSPIKFGVFPVPKYDLLGKKTMSGMGNFGFSGYKGRIKKVKEKRILYNSFYAGNSPFNVGKDSFVFFHIVVLTDFVDPDNFSHSASHVISRNHPHYTAQGSYVTTNNKIDYTAFFTADRNSYAIVNMRLFDLRLGKTILIAPQKDRSLRSMQINSPLLSRSEVDSYTDKLLKKKKVIKFFTADGTID